MKRLIIAGGRDYRPVAEDGEIIRKVVESLGVTEIISGGARGADEMGENYAKEMGIPLRVFPANWKQNGKAAGPIRNEIMASKADACLLFPGGRGTANMRMLAKRYGLQIIDAKPLSSRGRKGV